MAKKHVRCPRCRSLETKRHGTFGVAGRLIKRFLCQSCRLTFSLRHASGKGLSRKAKVDIARTHLEGRTSIRTLASQTKHSTRTVLKAIHQVTGECASAAWIAKELRPNWGGYLALDGKIIRVWDWAAKHFHYSPRQKGWLHKMTMLIALDLETLDIPTHHLGDEETTIDLIMLLKELKAVNYPLKGYVSDGNKDIAKAVNLVFGSGIPHQLCVRHYLQSLKVRLREEDITERQYQDAKEALHQGARPRLLKVPDELFTYRTVPELPTTNQQLENLIRYFNLRLKTINQFRSWESARDFCNALTLMRRFTKFTDCRNKAKNHQAPLELAGVDITNLDYLNLKSNT